MKYKFTSLSCDYSVRLAHSVSISIESLDVQNSEIDTRIENKTGDIDTKAKLIKILRTECHPRPTILGSREAWYILNDIIDALQMRSPTIPIFMMHEFGFFPRCCAWVEHDRTSILFSNSGLRQILKPRVEFPFSVEKISVYLNGSTADVEIHSTVFQPCWSSKCSKKSFFYGHGNTKLPNLKCRVPPSLHWTKFVWWQLQERRFRTSAWKQC